MTWPNVPSPFYSADDDSSTDVLPFTAFGQFGEGNMDNRVFDQDEYWVDIKGTGYLLTEMTDAYKANVIMFLRDGVDYFYFHAVLRHTAELLLDWYDDNLYANTDLLSKNLGVPVISDLTSQEWLESTPLMRRLLLLMDTS